MPTKITSFETHDLRFPTSLGRDGSDAMNPDPDYSAAYVVLQTDSPELCGHGMTFTIGRGNEICIAAIRSLAELLVDCDVESLMKHPVTLYRRLTGDSQLRWIGPEKGVIHLAAAAVINAVWDLWARIHQKPVWQLICQMSAEQLVSCIDFRYLTDAVTPLRPGNFCCRWNRTVSGGSSNCRNPATPATQPQPAGWAIPTTSCEKSAGTSENAAGPALRSRSDGISQTTSVAVECCGPRWAIRLI